MSLQFLVRTTFLGYTLLAWLVTAGFGGLVVYLLWTSAPPARNRRVIRGINADLLASAGAESTSSSEREREGQLQLQPSTDLADFARTSWCKRAIREINEACCPIFDFITETHQKYVETALTREHPNLSPEERECALVDRERWGTMLDAGTGMHSLEWMIARPTSRWTAISGDPHRRSHMLSKFGERVREQDEVIAGNWKDLNFLKGQVFDVVLADYLLGSVDGYAPYYQDRLFPRLRPHVGKVLYVVGAEPLPDIVPRNNIHGNLIVEIAKLRDACSLLAGERPYREYPLDWTLRHMKLAGFNVTNVGFFDTFHDKDFVEIQLDVAAQKLSRFRDDALHATMQNSIQKLRKRVRALKWNIRFGSDYVIAAVPVSPSDSSSPSSSSTATPSSSASASSSSSSSSSTAKAASVDRPVSLYKGEGTPDEEEVRKFVPNYRSEVQEQEEVFPRDDESAHSRNEL